MSKEAREQIAGVLGDTKPAQDGLLAQLAESARDYRAYREGRTEGTNSFYGLNLSAFMGERMGPVLRRLLDAEAEVEKLRERLVGLEASVAADRPVDEDPIAYELTPAAESSLRLRRFLGGEPL
jgi:hypothetical protein